MKLTTFKNIDINVDSDGIFSCNIDGNIFRNSNFEWIKKEISKEKGEYYTITEMDYNRMINKLSLKEREFINELMEAYYQHLNSAYCELGETMENFDVEWNDIIKK